MKKFKTFVFNTILLSISSLIMNIISISFSIYISKEIGTEALGIYQLIISIYVFAITIATSGISIAVTHLISAKLALKKYSDVKKIARQSIILSFFTGCFAMILLIIFSNTLTNTFLHGKVSHLSFIFLALSLPPLAISASINGYFAAVTRVIKSASAQFIEQFFKIIISVYFFKLLLPNTIENACLSLVLGSLLSEIISFIYLFLVYIIDKKRYSKNLNTKRSYVKDILKISFPIAIASYIRSFLSTLKQIIIPIRLQKFGMSCELALSQYGMISGMVLQIIWFPCLFINVFAGLLIPEYSRLYALKNTKRISNVTSKIFKMAIIFSIGFFGIFFTFSDNIAMALYNNIEVGKYIKIISPLVLIMYFDNVVDGMLKGLNNQVGVMKCNILDLFVSIILMYILLPIYGIYGYIIVIYISEVLNDAISFIQLIKVTKFKISLFNNIIKPAICIFLANWTIYFLFDMYNIKTITLIFEILIYVLFYILFLLLSCAITKKDFIEH